MIVLTAFIAIGAAIGLLCIAMLFNRALRRGFWPIQIGLSLSGWGALAFTDLIYIFGSHVSKDEMIGSVIWGVIFFVVGLILATIALIARRRSAQF